MQAPNLDRILQASGPFEPEAMSVSEARGIARRFFIDQEGYSRVPRLLTHPDGQMKLAKSARYTVGLTLAAAAQSGWNVCTWSTGPCREACVMNTAGNARYESVKVARIVKTRFLAEHPQAFVTLLHSELVATVKRRGPIDYRSNVASDLRWESIAPALLSIPDVRVYDYTKAPAAHRAPTDNYRLTFSVSDRAASTREAIEYLESGHNAAVVFATLRGHALPATWEGFDVVDGDTSDARFDDQPGTVVGLRAKGAAIGNNAGGFVKPAVAS